MPDEHLLPEELSLNTAVAEQKDDIHEELARLTEELGDLIDPINEFPSLKKTEELWGVSCAFGDAIADEIGTDRDHARIAAYRACCFADQITNMILPTNSTYPIGDYLYTVMRTDEPILTIRKDAATYLSERPNVDALLRYYIEAISQSKDVQVRSIALTVAAIMFSLAEQNMTEEYLSDELDELAHNLPTESDG